MGETLTRRQLILDTVKWGALAQLGDSFVAHALASSPGGSAAGQVPLASDIEPLARLIEETPRDRLVETMAARVRAGVGPAPLWAAVLLAGARGIRPRPVGFKFHAVLVVNSAALTSRESARADLWLPLFWTMDNFKVSQAKNLAEGGWSMKALAESSLPSAAQARALFEEGMERWDEDKADRAVAVLYRTAGANDIAELFFRYGARDFRDVGHKAIYVANAWRILSTLGWRHAEPVLRSLAFALLAHDGTNPAHGDLEADRPWRENKPRAQRIRAGWQEGRSSREATLDLWAVLRSGAWRDACEKTVELVNAGISPDSLWDAFLLRAGELLMQQPGIFGIHCVTSANALRFAFDAAAGDETRRLLLLQQAAFLPMFRDAMKAHGPLAEGLRLDRLEPLVPTQPGEEAIAEIFRDMGASRERASRKILAWAGRPASDPQALARTARHLVANKAHNAHDYKFAAAALEDVHKISPSWRAHFLASAAYDLVPSTLSDSEITRATRAALP